MHYYSTLFIPRGYSVSLIDFQPNLIFLNDKCKAKITEYWFVLEDIQKVCIQLGKEVVSKGRTATYKGKGSM